MSLVDIFKGELTIENWDREALRPPIPSLNNFISDLRQHDMCYMRAGLTREERIQFLFLRLLHSMAYHAGWSFENAKVGLSCPSEETMLRIKKIAIDMEVPISDWKPYTDPEEILRQEVISFVIRWLKGQEKLDPQSDLADLPGKIDNDLPYRTLPRQACRVCGNKDLSILGRKNGRLVACCSMCDFIFVADWFTADAIALYGREPYLEYLCPRHEYRNTEFLTYSLQRLDHVKPRLEILDFGCGNGWLMNKLTEMGYKAAGVDIVPPPVRTENRWTGDIRDFPADNPLFDLVVSFQVFEHLPYPRPYFTRMVELVRPGGLVVVHTDMETSDRSQNPLAWDYFNPPAHSSLYRHKTFKVLAEGLPAQIVYGNPWQVCFEIGENKP